MKKIAVIIVAAGRGERAGGSTPKQYVKIAGKEILRHTIEAFLSHPHIEQENIRIVINENDLKLYENTVSDLNLKRAIFGGNTRQGSVRRGLQSLANKPYKKVLIHDAARPFVSHKIIDDILNGLQSNNAVIPVIKLSDTIKRVVNGQTVATVDRSDLMRVQTPQGFNYQMIFDLHQRSEGMDFPDDSSICEDFGIKVTTVNGDESNYKITSADDLKRAEYEKSNQ